MWLNLFKQHGLIAVLRASSKADAITLARGIFEGGIRLIEITFTIPDAIEVIRELCEDVFFKEAYIGAGTLLNISDAKAAINAGARYLVSPHFDPEIAIFAKEMNVLYAPGCMTITEMVTAMRYDVGVIKLFPGSHFGPDYIKSIKGPFPHIQIMPTGGVSLENLHAWFRAGAIACGIGSDLTAPYKDHGIEEVIHQSKAYVDLFNNFKKEESHG